MTLDELRQVVLAELDTERWTTPTELGGWLDLGHGYHWYRLCLVLERLVVDGEAEIQRPGRTVRRFRRRAA